MISVWSRKRAHNEQGSCQRYAARRWWRVILWAKELCRHVQCQCHHAILEHWQRHAQQAHIKYNHHLSTSFITSSSIHSYPNYIPSRLIFHRSGLTTHSRTLTKCAEDAICMPALPQEAHENRKYMRQTHHSNK